MKMSKTLKVALFVMALALYLSGSTKFILKTFFQTDQGFGPEPFPMEIWILRFHGVMGLSVLMLFGFLLRAHVLPSWRTKKGKKSGLLLCVQIGLIIITVPFLLYLVDEGLKDSVALIHSALGLTLLFPFILHLKKKIVS